ncbi:MAG: hypothetical protein US25_C0013G0003 [Candidatus Moranbacteria bacterium GW2011_GWE1_36_7]|nr:MAG: hypothetical protein UR99_C0003G0003 [Candidatus Moranbacteria bacterium GW2011_GWD2_36_12]KKQ06945.1 MAG: hypothetical protein US16_C0005G0003 [Candidatus Moranbacteria bacterium GW2011_GWE2_36_40]KKQ15089.1 MAG: hypothetical protein US25_C0013G0003 [Candidatus Moranbacteria bacterium GW2011_GWE1_36_7]
MLKQKNRFNVFIFSLIASCAFFVGAGNVQAAASAVVSWTPPTTDEGGGALTGLSGYKVYYNTVSTWLNVLGSCSEGLGTPVSTSVDVPGAGVSSYRFSNNLVAGQTYYFTVAAYDNASTPNFSKCATTTVGALKEVSKRLSYSGDINNDWVVNGGDITTMIGVYLTNNATADINKDGVVNGGDVTILAQDYLQPAL